MTISLLLLGAQPARAASNYITPYVFTTLAGFSSTGSSDGPGKFARFYSPRGIAIDQAGNLYVADAINDTIRKITPAGIVSTLAGTAGIFGAGMDPTLRPPLDGTGPAAIFSNPEGIAVDATGNIYVTDKMDFLVRKVTPDGVVTTIAGAPSQYGSADGTGSAARFYVQSGAATDAAGNIYTTDWLNNTIRKITPVGVVTTFAGQVGVNGHADGTGTGASFSQPMGIAADSAGMLYVADLGNGTLRKITPAGVVTTLAGSAGTSGSTDGPAASARFRGPSGVAVDAAGNIYIADTGNATIRKLSTQGTVTTIAGSAGQLGSTDGNGASARFRSPISLAIDSASVIYVADSSDNTVRKITANGDVTTLAGLGLDNSLGSADGSTSVAKFNTLAGTALAPNGDLFVADTFNSTIRKISGGQITTVAGKTGVQGGADGVGANARFVSPYGLVIDLHGNLFVSDPGNDTIRQIAPDGTVTTLAGNATAVSGSVDATGSAARFNYPSGTSIDASANLYVADRDNSTIRKITPAGVVSTLAGQAFAATGSTDGTGGAALFNHPTATAVSALGNVYVADTDNSTIRKISPAGVVTTLAGKAGQNGSVDGVGGAARFWAPDAVSVDASENVYVADTGNHLIRKIAPDGTVSTLAGLANVGGYADGAGPQSRFEATQGLTADAQGVLYVTTGSVLRKGQLAGPPVILQQPQGQTLAAGATAQFTVMANAAPDPTYQWSVSGHQIAGATTNTFSVANTRASDAGDYTVTISNSLGSVTSDKATLTINAATTPPPTSPSTNGSGSSGGGGGASSLWFLAALAALGWHGFGSQPRRFSSRG